MLEGAKLIMSADVDDDGMKEDGEFGLSAGIEITPGVRTGDLIGPTGSQAGAIIDFVANAANGRAGFNLDIGGGAATYQISFNGFEGHAAQWGDGSDNPAADASGEGVWRQMSVWQRYLDRGTYDSTNAASLEWGEYSKGGVYDPISVAIEEPSATFAAEEETSVWDGTVTLVSTRALSQAAYSQDQDEG
ncbi:MAG: hypothetical protein ACOCUA_02620 [archaeon]